MEGKYKGTSEWTRSKLEFVEKYLAEYVKILSSAVGKGYFDSFEYVDAFAGEGRYEDPETGDYVDGSPAVALSVEPAFSKYHFIEVDQIRTAKLESLKSEFQERTIMTYTGDASDVLVQTLAPQFERRLRKRVFMLLDPWGLQVHWETIKILAGLRTVEIFVNLSLVGLQRNVLLNRYEDIGENHRERMRRVWGNDDWEHDFYKTDQGLFEPITKKVDGSSELLASKYRGRLLELFEFCPEHVIMRNSKGGPVYALVFATHNKVGFKIMDYILRKYEKEH